MMEKISAAVSDLSAAIRNRVSPDSRLPRSTSNPSIAIGNTPSDQTYRRILNNASPEPSEGDRIPPRVSQPSSTDSIDNELSIDDRFSEARRLVTNLESIISHPNYSSLAPPLHSALVRKVDSLNDYINSQGLTGLYRKDILDLLTNSNKIRLTFSSNVQQPTRRRSSSTGDFPINGDPLQPIKFRSQHARRVLRESLGFNLESEDDVFHQNSTVATLMPTSNLAIASPNSHNSSVDEVSGTNRQIDASAESSNAAIQNPPRQDFSHCS